VELHGVQVEIDVAPIVLEYWSGRQLVHAALPVLVLYFPAVHRAHACLSPPVDPALHVQCTIAVLPSGEAELL